jgi:hypothetical protein
MPANDSFDDLANATIDTLRSLWATAHGCPPPRGLGRDLLIRSIACKRQEQVHGGLSQGLATDLARLAEQLDRSGHLDVERQPSLKVGTWLIREWRGRTLRVSVVEDGFLFEDRHYASLSQIAQSVTGTKWSGPRFFGLPQRSETQAGTGASI